MATKNGGGRKRGALARIEPNYIERAEVADRKTNVVLMRQAAQLWKTLQRNKSDLSGIAVEIVNNASQLGGVIVQICGGEQFGLSFWNVHCAEQLPFNFDAARELVSVFKKVPEPITDFSQIWPVWKQVNLALGTLQIPERMEEQSASNVSPLTAISHLAGEAVVRYERWKETEPLGGWPKDRLETFVVETKQIHDAHEEARTELAGRG